jgi:hypothetical protein
MVAQMLATIDVYSEARTAINVLTGWFKEASSASHGLIRTNAIGSPLKDETVEPNGRPSAADRCCGSLLGLSDAPSGFQ